LRGANVDLDAQTPLTCLNNEEFINQFERATGAEVNTGTDEAKIVTPKAIADSLIQTGWTPARETWEYESETEITVPSGAEDKYQKGDKIRLKQGGAYKYWPIIAVADELLTIAENDDYTLADAAITDNYYSHQENPIGFPSWFNWTPAYSASDSMTYTSVTTFHAKFTIIGTMVTMGLRCAGTTGGTASPFIQFSPPVNRAGTTGADCAIGGGCVILDPAATTTLRGGFWNLELSSVCQVSRYDRSNWSLGAGAQIRLSGSYEMA
jgi:hypothetical protein